MQLRKRERWVENRVVGWRFKIQDLYVTDKMQYSAWKQAHKLTKNCKTDRHGSWYGKITTCKNEKMRMTWKTSLLNRDY